MSEETPKITTVKKYKDPRRVEADRRLAAISKQARERKMREKILAENKQESDEETWSFKFGFAFGVVGVAAGIGSLFYACSDDQRETKGLETIY